MKISKGEKIATWVLYAAVAIWLLSLGVSNCKGQMTIPLVKGTVEEGNVLTPNGGSGEVFTLYKSTMESTTTNVNITFRRLRYERSSELNYPIDSIDISESMQDGYEKITLWVNNDHQLHLVDKIIVFANDNTYRMYVYYPEEIFYFSGKVH